MNIEEYIKMFKDVIRFNFKLNIGGKRSSRIVINKDFISSENRKGRALSLSINALYGTTELVPLDQTNVRLDLDIICEKDVKLDFNSKPTKLDGTKDNYIVSLLDDKDNLTGYLELYLTPAGDIEEKEVWYYNEDRTHVIKQNIYYEYDKDTKKIIPHETLSFINKNYETDKETVLTFNKCNGIIKGISVKERKNIDYDDRVLYPIEEVKDSSYLYSRYRNGEYTPSLYESYTSEIANEIISIDFINKENNLFSKFIGDYVGNTVIKNGDNVTLYVETIDSGFHYFSKVILNDLSAFNYDIIGQQHINPLNYYLDLEKTSKKPTFKVVIVDGREELVPLNDSITNEELKEFQKYKAHFILSIDELNKMDIKIPCNEKIKK